MTTTNEETPGEFEFDSFNQQVSLTVRIKEILTEYPDGSQVLREILQNSDDAASQEQ
ncbi:hypothetical protein BC937DRAFT_87375, partial [Endogone sp. FLAS-F59071]